MHWIIILRHLLFYLCKIKKQESFKDEGRTLSRKISRARIEHPTLSPVREELPPMMLPVSYALSPMNFHYCSRKRNATIVLLTMTSLYFNKFVVFFLCANKIVVSVEPYG